MLTRVMTLGLVGIIAATGGAGQLAGGQLEDLMKAYYSGGWQTGGQSRSQDLLPQYDDAVVVDNQDYQGDQPVKDEFGATLSGMMGALAEIQRKGDSMLAGIHRQREVLDQLESRAALAEQKRIEEEVVILELEEKKSSMEGKMEAMKREEEDWTQVKSSLAPILEKVSARTAELRVFEEAISGKKLELEEVARQLEEATTRLTELGTKSGLVPGTPPALLAVLAGSLIFNLAAGSHLASTVLAQQREGSPLLSQFSPLREDLSQFATFLGSQAEKVVDNAQKVASKAEPLLRKRLQSQRNKLEKRFKDKFSEEAYYDLPRRL